MPELFQEPLTDPAQSFSLGTAQEVDAFLRRGAARIAKDHRALVVRTASEASHAAVVVRSTAVVAEIAVAQSG